MSKSKSTDKIYVNAIVNIAEQMNKVVKNLSPQVNAFFDGFLGRKSDPTNSEDEAASRERAVQAERRKRESEEPPELDLQKVETLGSKYDRLAEMRKERDEIPPHLRPARF